MRQIAIVMELRGDHLEQSTEPIDDQMQQSVLAPIANSLHKVHVGQVLKRRPRIGNHFFDP